MKRAAIVLAILGVLVLLAVFAYLFLLRQVESPAEAVPVPGANLFGFSVGEDREPQDTLALALDDGTSVAVPDFTKENQPEWAGESAGYLVAGSETGDYLITYIMPDRFGSQAQFLVSLLTEPLGEARTEAERALAARLLLSEQELCALDVQVWTRTDVNDAYAGKDLGLSFCPGSTQLP